MPTRRDTCILASAAKTGGELSCTSLSQVPPHYQLHDGLLGLSSQPQETFLHCVHSVCSLVAWAGALNSGALALDNVVHCNLENLHHTCKQKVQHTSRAKDPAMASILQYFRTLWLI